MIKNKIRTAKNFARTYSFEIAMIVGTAATTAAVVHAVNEEQKELERLEDKYGALGIIAFHAGH